VTKSEQGLDAIILAGGRGTRLQSVVSDVPKPMAPVNGRPFLDYQLTLLARSGVVRKAVLALGYQADKVIDHYRREGAPLPLEFVVEEEALGTGGALRFALAATDSDRVLALNGDSLFRWDLPALLDAHVRLDAAATLAVVGVPDTSRYGAVDVHEGLVRAFVEKAETSGPGLINAGLNLFERTVLEAIPQGRPLSVEQEVFPQLAQAGRLGAAAFSSDFIDIGLPETYAAAASVLPVMAGTDLMSSMSGRMT
jgi:NDP-sugar pyrophosphorylase family protein